MLLRSRKRRRDATDASPVGADEHAQLSRKYDVLRRAFDNVVAMLTCPISRRLPLKPVVAADGRMYERESIQAWFQHGNTDGHMLDKRRSPMTNAPMGTSLVDCCQHVGRIIECVADSGCIEEELRDEYVEAQMREERERLELLKRRVKRGEGEAALALAKIYSLGSRYTARNERKRVYWLEKGRPIHCTCECILGYLYVRGSEEVEANYVAAVQLLQSACDRGSEHAAYYMGQLFAAGECGLKKDACRAAYYFRRMKQCCTRDCCPAYRRQAEEWLQGYEPPRESWSSDEEGDGDEE